MRPLQGENGPDTSHICVKRDEEHHTNCQGPASRAPIKDNSQATKLEKPKLESRSAYNISSFTQDL